LSEIIKKQSWEALAPSWSAQAEDPTNYFTRRTYYVKELIARYMERGRALDIGCGPGLLSYLLAIQGFDVYGTDLAENMIDESIHRLSGLFPDAPRRFRVCKDGEIPFEGLQFDLISAIDVLPYIEDWPAYISKLSMLLKPGGLYVTTVVNRRSFFVGLAIAEQFVRYPLTRDASKLRQTVVNLSRTGYWSGGFVDYDKARQCYSPDDLDNFMNQQGYDLVDSIELMKLPSALDREALTRGTLGKRLVRALGWHYIAVYRKSP